MHDVILKYWRTAINSRPFLLLAVRFTDMNPLLLKRIALKRFQDKQNMRARFAALQKPRNENGIS